jgi:DNA-binding Lrp family transcriptional regulator
MNITEASKIMKTVALSKSKLDKKNERIKQLETELAEAKEMIACLRVTNDEYGKRSEERLSELAEAKEKYETINNLWTGLVKRSVEINKENAEFKRQIAEHEHNATVKYDLLWDEAEKIRIQRDVANGELSEWKDTLGGYGDGPENVLHWIQGATTRCILSEEYERQIACGELVKFKTLIEYGFFDHHTPEGQNRMEKEFRQFAAEYE